MRTILTILALFTTGPAIAADGEPPFDPVVATVETYDSDRLQRLQAQFDFWGYRWRDGIVTFAGERSRLPADAVIDEAATALLRGEVVFPKGQDGGIPGFPCYRTVAETEATLADLAAANPDLVSVDSYGESWERLEGLEGSELLALTITNQNVPGPKPVLMIMSTMHARELTTAEASLRFGEWLLEGYETDAERRWIVDHVETVILPQHNPDGRHRVEGGILLWRKNANADYCVSSPNGAGADLNRNADTVFWGGRQSSGSQCSNTYRGPTQASEPETQALEALVAERFTDYRDGDILTGADEDVMGIFISVHSFGEFVFYPWEGTNINTADEFGYKALTQRMAHLSSYTSCQNCCLGAIGGTSVDQVYEAVGAASLTLELGTRFDEACDDFESRIQLEAREVFRYAAIAARRPYDSSFGPRITDVEAVSNGDGTVTVTALASDADYAVNPPQCTGTADTVLTPRAISGASITLAQPPWLAAESIPMTAADGAFDDVVEVVTVTLPAGALPVGSRETVFVVAADSDGDVGPPGAAFATAQAKPPEELFEDGFEFDTPIPLGR